MRFELENLPSDTALLHRLVREMAVVVDSRDGEIERLQSIIKKLQRAQFGRRSERLDADQLALALEDLDGDVARIRESRPATATDALEARSRRKPLPDHPPRKDVSLTLSPIACSAPSQQPQISSAIVSTAPDRKAERPVAHLGR